MPIPEAWVGAVTTASYTPVAPGQLSSWAAVHFGSFLAVGGGGWPLI